MSLVIHKYMPEEMSEAELEGTFAAREHTLEYLLKALRDQIGSASPSSFLVSGPRGAGKSTLLRMLRLRIRQDPGLAAAWLPVPFPENQYHVASLRDLLAGALDILVRLDVPEAEQWLRQVEQETHDEQSQEIAISGLREIARQEGKRLIIFAENLDQLFERGLDDKMKRTLRRLLMTDPFMILVGSAVHHAIDALRDYDEAFFNYFHPVALDRLSEDQVVVLLGKRAEFDGNAAFLQALPRSQARIKAIAHLSGGNPRLILMLYELLSEQRVTSIVQQLRRLVDELTPVLQCEMDRLPPQQQKIIHALMERGGTASPKDLTGPTRLSLNSVTQQLRRLRDAQVLAVSGGGKGRPAFYTVPDKLFAIWYQMRCLRRQRRRIEMFVEVLQVWFEAEERFAVLRSLVTNAEANGSGALKDAAPTAEYFAASLARTPYEDKAREMMLRPWIKAGEIVEAARAHAAFCSIRAKDERAYDVQALLSLGEWCREHDHPQAALEALQKAAGDSKDPAVRIRYARALRDSGRTVEAVSEYTCVLEARSSDAGLCSHARFGRGEAREELGDQQGAVADYTVVIEMVDAPKDQVAWALLRRGVAKSGFGDAQGSLADYTAVIELAGAPKEQVTLAMISRALSKIRLGDLQGVVADCTAVIEMAGAPKNLAAMVLFFRGVAKIQLGDLQRGIADLTSVTEMAEASGNFAARALLVRGLVKGVLGDSPGAIADHGTVLEAVDVSKDLVAKALVNRGRAKGRLGDAQGEMADYTVVIGMADAPKDEVASALVNRGRAKGRLGDAQGEMADYTVVIEMADAPKDEVALALLRRGEASGKSGKVLDRYRDWQRVLRLPDLPIEDRTELAREIFRGLWRAREHSHAIEILDRLDEWLEALDIAQRVIAVLDLLTGLAMPDMKEAWPAVWRKLVSSQPAEVLERLDVLRPVVEVLEMGNTALLHSLPPEQREFAERILKGFEAPKT